MPRYQTFDMVRNEKDDLQIADGTHRIWPSLEAAIRDSGGVGIVVPDGESEDSYFLMPPTQEGEEPGDPAWVRVAKAYSPPPGWRQKPDTAGFNRAARRAAKKGKK